MLRPLPLSLSGGGERGGGSARAHAAAGKVGSDPILSRRFFAQRATRAGFAARRRKRKTAKSMSTQLFQPQVCRVSAANLASMAPNPQPRLAPVAKSCRDSRRAYPSTARHSTAQRGVRGAPALPQNFQTSKPPNFSVKSRLQVNTFFFMIF